MEVWGSRVSGLPSSASPEERCRINSALVVLAWLGLGLGLGLGLVLGLGLATLTLTLTLTVVLTLTAPHCWPAPPRTSGEAWRARR